MKTLIMSAVVAFASIQMSYAGSYDFKCSLYNLDKDDAINTLNFNRDEASLNNSLRLSIKDANIKIYEESITYQDEKEKNNISVKLSNASEIVTLVGAIGKREHYVEVYSVKAEVNFNGQVSSYQGTCTETTVTTCGGSCE